MSDGVDLRDEIAPAGSPLDVALRFAPAESAPTLIAVLAVAAEIREVPSSCSEPTLAQVKLAWWREEIDALPDAARHPATRALGRLAPRLDPAPLLALIDRADRCLDAGSPRAARELAAEAHGIAARTALASSGCDDPDALDCAHELGTIAGALAELRGAGEPADGELADWSMRLEAAHRAACALAGRDDRMLLAPFAALARIRRDALERGARTGSAAGVWRWPWLAWRIARRYARGR